MCLRTKKERVGERDTKREKVGDRGREMERQTDRQRQRQRQRQRLTDKERHNTDKEQVRDIKWTKREGEVLKLIKCSGILSRQIGL